MRKGMVIGTISALLLLLAAAGVQAEPMQLYYDGAWHDYIGNIFTLKVAGGVLSTEVPPVVFSDRSVVPARDVFERLGASVEWDSAQELVTVSSEDTLVKLQIDNTRAYVNGTPREMEIPPKLINGKTMIPARFVSEQLGLAVEFDSNTDTIVIDKAISRPVAGRVTFEARDDKISVHIPIDQTGVIYQDFTMADPARIVLDIQDAHLVQQQSTLAVSVGNVQQIRLGESDSRVRVVVDVSANYGYQVREASDGLYLEVTVKENTAAAVPSPKPTPPETNTPPPEKAERFVVLDAGHGGSDSGALGKDADGNTIVDENGSPAAVEKEINLDVTKRVRDILTAQGVTVKMTRETDVLVDLYEIPEIANEAGAPLFVSIHTNSVDGAPGANGIEVWGYLEGGSEVAGMTSRRLSEILLEHVIAETGAKNRGVKDGKNLVVVRKTSMPAALVEVGFITNEAERANLMDDAYRQKLADGIAAGILHALGEMGA